MIPKVVIENIIDLWPIIVLTTVVLITTRLVNLISNKRKIELYKEILSLLFIVYIILLFRLVTSSDMSSFGNNFIPFKEMFRYKTDNPLFYRNVIGNILLFIPFGFFTSYFIRITKVRYNLIISFITSTTIEIIQMCIGRSFDIDDIILNVIGGFWGYILYLLVNKLFGKVSSKVKNGLVLNLIFVILIIILIWIILSIYGVWL